MSLYVVSDSRDGDGPFRPFDLRMSVSLASEEGNDDYVEQRLSAMEMGDKIILSTRMSVERVK